MRVLHVRTINDFMTSIKEAICHLEVKLMPQFGKNIPLQDRLIVGLDVPDWATAAKIVEQLGDTVNFYKIGYQLAFAGGFHFIHDLRRLGKRVFLDMKLLDIDNTVAKAVENILRLDVSMLTIHAYPQAMRAAAKAAKGSDLTLLAVTVLTSMDESDLAQAGYQTTPAELVKLRATQAMEAGFGGIVASAQEASILRPLIGKDKAVVTPGIRLEQAINDDQKRVMTPAAALAAGASHLVVARPIIQAADPRRAARAILNDMAKAISEK